MRQLPPSIRLTVLPGVLAVAAVALALAMFVGGPDPGKEVEVCAAPAVCCPTDGPSVFRQRESLSSREALRQDPPVAWGLNTRVSKSGILVVPTGGVPAVRPSAWLGHARGPRPVVSSPSLHVLFCTWLT